jgi:hypothetical protein
MRWSGCAIIQRTMRILTPDALSPVKNPTLWKKHEPSIG